MADVYKVVGEHEIAEKWITSKQESHKNDTFSLARSENNENSRPAAKHSDRDANGLNKRSETFSSDSKSVCWGPAQKSQERLYRNNDHCCKCGLKPWSDPDYSCRKAGMEPKPATEEKKRVTPQATAMNSSKDSEFFLLRLSSIDVQENNDMEYDACINVQATVAKPNLGAPHTFMRPVQFSTLQNTVPYIKGAPDYSRCDFDELSNLLAHYFSQD